MHPKHFRKALKRFDPRLDFKWNGRKNLWQVVGRDRRNKEYVIHNVPLGKLDELGPWIIEQMAAVTPHKQGGADEINRMLDEQIEAEEKRQEKASRDAFDAVSEDVFRTWQMVDGESVSIPSGFTVNDKRRIRPKAVGA